MDPVSLTEDQLEALAWVSVDYFLKEVNHHNGLIRDKTQDGAPASIAAVAMALATAPLAVESGGAPRAFMARRTLNRLRFFWNSPQGTQPDATGYKGFYYHFLDMESGRRVWDCELSTVDSAFLLAGVLAVATYFDQDTAEEHEIRTLGDALYRRADWRWAQNGGATLTHGWKPESGFLPYRWEGYDEALLLYMLALGSPTYPLPEESYAAWASTYEWKKIYDWELLYCGPLFMHQLSHLWIDFRGIQDAFMRAHGIDYFENSRRATYVQQAYAIRNPKRFAAYGEHLWGITASNGPGPATRRVNGVTRRFMGYRARAVPYGPDDGTLAPWAVVASLPFAPEIVLPALRYCLDRYPAAAKAHGLVCSINPTFPGSPHRPGPWISHAHFALDQGPIILMIENYRSGLLWRLMRRCPFVVNGLRRAGFNDGWLTAGA